MFATDFQFSAVIELVNSLVETTRNQSCDACRCVGGKKFMALCNKCYMCVDRAAVANK